DRSVQRCTARAVGAIHEAWIGVEQCTDLPQVACLGGKVNRMVRMGFGRYDPAPSVARALEYVGDGIEATVSCRLDQRVAVQPHLVRVRTCVKQESHGLEVSFTDGETYGRILSRQRRIAFEQTT